VTGYDEYIGGVAVINNYAYVVSQLSIVSDYNSTVLVFDLNDPNSLGTEVFICNGSQIPVSGIK
jgi:hypothetical protein